MEGGDEVREVVRLDRRVVVGVELEAVVVGVEEHDPPGGAALAEHQHRGLDPRIGVEHPARQRQHRLDGVVLDEPAAELAMRAGGPEQDPLGRHHRAAPALLQVVQHVLQEQELRLRRPSDLHLVDDPILVQPAGEGGIGEDHVEAPRRKAQLRLRRPVEGAGQGVAAQHAHPIEPAQGQVHGGEADHLRVHVVAEEGLLVQPAHRVAAQSVAEPAPDRLAFRLHLLDPVRQRVREPDMVVGADQEPRGPGRRVVDGLPKARVPRARPWPG